MLIGLPVALFGKRRRLFRLLQIGSILLIPAALLSISSRYLRSRIVPGDTMVCGGHVCSKNTLCALNILYCVSKTSFLKKAFFLFCVALIDRRSKMKGTYLKTWALFLEIRPAPTAKEEFFFFLVPCWRSSRCSMNIVQPVKGRWDGRIKFTKAH